MTDTRAGDTSHARALLSAPDPICRWLASSIDTPSVAYQDWLAGRPAVLRLGRVCDAVRMPPALVHSAIGSESLPHVAAALQHRLAGGPVIADPGVWYWALVPPGTTETWRCPLAVVRGVGGWLGVPPPTRTQAATLHWAVPPRQARRLCAPDTVADLLCAGQARLEGIAR